VLNATSRTAARKVTRSRARPTGDFGMVKALLESVLGSISGDRERCRRAPQLIGEPPVAIDIGVQRE
jgi:hypothetical protein